jgi:hypothetical protein
MVFAPPMYSAHLLAEAYADARDEGEHWISTRGND